MGSVVASPPLLTARHRRDPRVRTSFAAPAAYAVMLMAAAAMAALRSQVSPGVDLGVMAGLVAMSGWFTAWGAVLATAGYAWLMLNGFVADRYGVLHWHGSSDVVRFVVLFACGLIVAVAREMQLRGRRRQESGSDLDLEPCELTRAARRTRGEKRA